VKILIQIIHAGVALSLINLVLWTERWGCLFIIINTLARDKELAKELLQTRSQCNLVRVRTANKLNVTNKSLN
jgi:hypothetical protein